MRDKINEYFARRRYIQSEKQSLDRIPPLTCNGSSLRTVTKRDLAKIFNANDIHQAWTQAELELRSACRIEDGTTGGVNPGDRRAVWYLVKALRATSVLEIGTHVG